MADEPKTKKTVTLGAPCILERLMTAEEIATIPERLEHRAKILEDNGIEVLQYLPSRPEDYWLGRGRIIFLGDESEGPRVFEIAERHKFPVRGISLNWSAHKGILSEEGVWEIIFLDM